MTRVKRAPIALFAYNRPDHVRTTLDTLAGNDGAAESDLVAFLDGPRNEADQEPVDRVRREVERKRGRFKSLEIVRSQTNRGLATSIIEGVTELLRHSPSVIVFEDDLASHRRTLNYFRDMLAAYEAFPAVFSIAAYTFPDDLFALPSEYPFDVYAIRRMQCWGWATWRDRWEKADFSVPDYDAFMANAYLCDQYRKWIGADSFRTLEACLRQGKDVWACRWVYAHFRNHALCMCPRRSYIDNVGLDGSGSNCGVEDRRRNSLDWDQPEKLRLPDQLSLDLEVYKNFLNVFDPNTSRF